MDITNFAQIILEYRQAKKLTQEEFASKIGVTPQAVSKWERALGLPDISVIHGICTILDISADELFGIKLNRVENVNSLLQNDEIRNRICSDPIVVSFGEALIPFFVEGLQTNLIFEQRKQLLQETGILIPTFRLMDDIKLEQNEFCIKLYDKVFVNQTLENIENSYADIISILFETCRVNFKYILNKQIVKMVVDAVKQMYPGITDGIIPEKVSYLTYQKVLCAILKKGGLIKNQIRIMECVEEEMVQKGNTDVDAVATAYLSKKEE